MCLIAVATSTDYLDTDRLAEALAGNPDGFGFMAAVKGKILHEKFPGADDLAGYENLFRERMEHWKSVADGAVAIHLRQRTHGPRNGAMAHPFPLETGNFSGLLMHNGIFWSAELSWLANFLNVDVPFETGLSDSAMLVKILEAGKVGPEGVRDVLMRLVNANPFNRVVVWGHGEKLPLIFNFEAGTLRDNGHLWYSNEWYFSHQ